MRISSALFFQTGLESINAQQSDLLHLYRQIGSGQRMVTPADDPLAAAQAISISQAQSLNLRLAANRSVAERNLGTEENILASVTTLLQDIKTRLIEAGNGTLSEADTKTLANVLAMGRESLLALANSTDGNGQYLFSGGRGDVAPYAADGAGKIVWHGDGGRRLIQIDQTRRIEGGDTGADIFQRASPGVKAYLSQAGGANSGTGRISSPGITDPGGPGVGHNFDIEFSAGLPLHYRITVIDPQGALPPWDGGWQEYDPATESLEMPDASGAPAGVTVRFSGVPAPGDTFGLRTVASSDLNIFDTLDDIASALASAISGSEQSAVMLGNALASAMQRLDINYDNMLTVRASVGARLDEIGALDAAGDLRNLGYAGQLSMLEDLDYYSATTRLELRSAALEAAALAFRKIQGASLFTLGGG